jgi:hypothetical protein
VGKIALPRASKIELGEEPPPSTIPAGDLAHLSYRCADLAVHEPRSTLHLILVVPASLHDSVNQTGTNKSFFFGLLKPFITQHSEVQYWYQEIYQPQRRPCSNKDKQKKNES